MRAHAEANGTTGSGVVEGLLRGFFEMPEREQKEKVAPIPRYERKGFPRIPMKTDMNGAPPDPPDPRVERVRVMTTPELGPKAAWVEKGPADRVQVMKDIQEAKAAFEKTDEVKPKAAETIKKLDAAAKIFTF